MFPQYFSVCLILNLVIDIYININMDIKSCWCSHNIGAVTAKKPNRNHNQHIFFTVTVMVMCEVNFGRLTELCRWVDVPGGTNEPSGRICIYLANSQSPTFTFLFQNIACLEVAYISLYLPNSPPNHFQNIPCLDLATATTWFNLSVSICNVLWVGRNWQVSGLMRWLNPYYASRPLPYLLNPLLNSPF